MGQTTITVEDSTLTRFKETKAKLDNQQDSVPDHSADSFLNALLDTWDASDAEKDTPVDLRKDIGDEVRQIITEELEPVAANQGVTQNPGVDADAIVGQIKGRIDDLETELPRKVADEMKQR